MARLAAYGPALLLGFVALVVVAVLATGQAGQRARDAAVVASVELQFEDGPAGSVEVYAAGSDQLLQRFAAGEGSFVRGVLRSMTRERRGMEVGREQPFMLTRHSDGALVLLDEATGRSMVLNAFGPTNAGVFDQLLDAAGSSS